MFYKRILRPLLFTLDSETIHHLSLSLAALVQNPPLARLVQSAFHFEDPRLSVDLFGLKFPNPLGLAAGFDKGCAAPRFFQSLGFGHVELGTVTYQPQPGNPRPRIFRLVRDRALINRMGFPSPGALEVAAKISRARSQGYTGILGINIGKSKVVPIDEAVSDYVACFRELRDLGDYFVLNVSSPNTPELRKLQESERLSALLEAIQAENRSAKPLLVKIAPDLTDAEIGDVLGVCLKASVAGIVATNTTFSRTGLQAKTEETGGLSGAPLYPRALEIVRLVHRQTQGKLPVIGVGGIFSLEHVLEFLQAGARLVQLYTGFIYEGPIVIKRIKQDLVRTLDQTGKVSVMQLIGDDSK